MGKSNELLTEDKSGSNLAEVLLDEDADVLPDDLSGDENVERSILLAEVKKSGATKASKDRMMQTSS
jgi:hypothetical protein